ncbi:hypothetical protein H0H93_010182 [Arthromyces matolae]|nr:hypothetical protein H0H93_010182 [Arthromyces matolae]
MSVTDDLNPDTKKQDELLHIAHAQSFDLTNVIPVRPPMDYSSPAAFATSLSRRWKSIWTRRFVLALLAGQVVSLCITCTNVTTTELVNRNWSLPTTQTFFLYFSIFAIYTPYTIYQYGFKGWGNMILRDGWKYFILACFDVEGNFLVVKAYQYTDLLSCMLLDAWAIPVCMFVSWLYMRPRYHWTQILGVFICVAGLGLLVASDELTDKDWTALDRAKGDGFMIAGATLYGLCECQEIGISSVLPDYLPVANATEEFFVRKRPLYEVVGQLGMWGTLINGIQAAGLEHEAMKLATWNRMTIGILVAYTAAMFILYTVAPMLYRLASSTYYNLSLLTSDFWGLLFGLFLYHYRPYWLYFIAYIVVIAGLITYFWHSTPEEQGESVPSAPSYVNKRGAPALPPSPILA